MIKPMPVGVSDFKKVRERYYFVDKSDFIRQFIDNHKDVTLFTRPRRFGKTLLMSMLEYFFSMHKKDVSASLFAGLAIETAGSHYMAERGRYPVVFMTLKNFYSSSWESMYKSMQLMMQQTYGRFAYILESEELLGYEKEYIQRILTCQAELEEYQQSLQLLLQILYKVHHEYPVLLIDEYDAPLQQAYSHGFYDQAIAFWRSWFNGSLKDNEYLKFAVLTGVQRIARESIFSGLNNLDVYTILDEKYSDAFGFTTQEVEMMAQYTGYENKLFEIKQWYDGYRFGTNEIYNPWSVLKYLDNLGKPAAYWMNTSDNKILKDLLHHSNDLQVQNLNGLLQQQPVIAVVQDGMMYEQIFHNQNALYTMLLTTGYLTVADSLDGADNRYLLRIPNEEIKRVYCSEILDHLLQKSNRDSFDTLFSSLISGNGEQFERQLQRILLQFVSLYDTANKESFYHGFMLGMTALFLNSSYQVESNRESGYGRFDVALIPRDSKYAGVIMEFKVAQNTEGLNEKAQEAVQQIEDKNYIAVLEKQQVKRIWKYGIAFCGKQVKVMQGRK